MAVVDSIDFILVVLFVQKKNLALSEGDGLSSSDLTGAYMYLFLSVELMIIILLNRFPMEIFYKCRAYSSQNMTWQEYDGEYKINK